MRRRCNLAHLILAVVVALVLTLLMVVVDAQAQIVFMSDRVWDDWQWEIYVMDTDGDNQRNLITPLVMTSIPPGPLMANRLSLPRIGMIGMGTGDKST